jgi:ribosomal protein S12 methylthiotransferase accessory factor
MRADRRVEIVGEDRLARALIDRLPSLLPGTTIGRPPSEAASRAPCVLVTRLDRERELRPWLRQRRDLLTVGSWRGLVYIGPFRVGTERGCFSCLVSRVAGTPHGPEREPSDAVSPEPAASPSSWSPLCLSTVPALVSVELGERLRHARPRTSSGVLVADGESGAVSFETLIPSSTCPVCGGEDDGGRPLWSRSGRDALPCDGRRLRTSDARALSRTIEPLYLNPRIGLVHEVQIDLQSPYGACYIDLPLQRRRAEPCIGRGTTYAKARAVALLESLERYCGWNRGGPRPIVTAPYEEVQAQAVHPPSLGLHPDRCYDEPDYRFVRFDPRLPVDWVWGHSLGRDAPILVPARHAFYGHGADRSPAFAMEVSNGCALGATLDEAVIHGLLELVERDSFLLTWYRRLALPEVSTGDIPDREVAEMLRRAELVTDSSIRIFLSTREHGIPSLFGVATGHRPDGPRTLAAAASHPNLVEALRSLLYELSGLTLRMQSILLERREEARAMLDDSGLVRGMEDHALVNCLPEARRRFAFLLESGGDRLSFPAAMALGGPPWPEALDLRQAFSRLTAAILGLGLDVVVVDQTMSELAPAGLHCVKVMVPGLLPMTFGHRYRRTSSLPRLLAHDPLARAAPDEVGVVPHPFP